MKKILFVILVSISSIAYADWTLIERDIEGTVLVYIDKSTIQQNGQYLRVWERIEYSEKNDMAIKNNVRSTRTYMEFDCREKKSRVLSFTSFTKPNLISQKNSLNQTMEWEFIAPKTIFETVLIHVCKSK
jgi:hypothetical protein